MSSVTQGYLVNSRFFHKDLLDPEKNKPIANNEPIGGVTPLSTQTPGTFVPGQMLLSGTYVTESTLPGTKKELCALKHMINVKQGGRGKSWKQKELSQLITQFELKKSVSGMSKPDMVNLLCQFVGRECSSGCAPEQLRK